MGTASMFHAPMVRGFAIVDDDGIGNRHGDGGGGDDLRSGAGLAHFGDHGRHQMVAMNVGQKDEVGRGKAFKAALRGIDIDGLPAAFPHMTKLACWNDGDLQRAGAGFEFFHVAGGERAGKACKKSGDKDEKGAFRFFRVSSCWRILQRDRQESGSAAWACLPNATH